MTIHTVQYSDDITFTDTNGVTFENATTGEITNNVVIESFSPNDVLQFDVAWIFPPVLGDVIKYRYNAKSILDFKFDTTVDLVGVGNTVVNKNVAGSINFTMIGTNLVNAHRSILSVTGNTFFYSYLAYVSGKHHIAVSFFGTGAIIATGLDIVENVPYNVEIFWGAGTGAQTGIKINGVVIKTGVSGGSNFTGNLKINGDITGTDGINVNLWDFDVVSEGVVMHRYALREGSGLVAFDTGDTGGKDGVIDLGSGEWLPAGTFKDSEGVPLSGAIYNMTNCSLPHMIAIKGWTGSEDCL